jgi:hypothetical protein
MFIDLCFYWHNSNEILAMQRVLRWLADRSFGVEGSTLFLKADRGMLPRFCGLYYASLPSDVLIERNVTGADDLFADQLWTPADAKLLSPALGTVRVQYGLISEKSYAAGEPHPIGLSIDGTDLHTIEIATETDRAVDENVRMRATTAARARYVLFEGICAQLQPDYASNRWDNGLDPPTSLVSKADPRAFNGLYVAQSVAPFVHFYRELGVCAGWNCEYRENGSWVWFDERVKDTAGLCEGVTVLRRAIADALLRAGSRFESRESNGP